MKNLTKPIPIRNIMFKTVFTDNITNHPLFRTPISEPQNTFAFKGF